jgi:hypothetical protein
MSPWDVSLSHRPAPLVPAAWAQDWIERWGREQTEIDALAALRPEVLRRIPEDAVKPFFDSTLDRGLRAEQAIDELEITLKEGAGAIRSVVDDARDSARQQLPEPDEWQPDADDAGTPLFTKDDDYVAATRKLRARKALAGEDEKS